MRAVKIKHLGFIAAIFLLIFVIDKTGILLHYYSKDYYKEFTYPLEGDIRESMDQLRRGEDPSKSPVNQHDYFMLRQAKGKCTLSKSGKNDKNIRIVYVVKSAMDHFEHRNVIRKTWGYEKRFSDVTIKTVFLLGSTLDKNDKLMKQVNDESKEFGDIVQGDFIDSYYNNTIKTMMGLRWAAEICPHARFYAFFDDDYYVSTRNMLRFLRNPVNYPRYLQEDVIHFDGNQGSNLRKLKQLVDFDLPEDVELYAGYVFHSRPHRHKFSKWYLTLEDYPYHYLPPYVTAGGYILSRNAMKDFYYASYFVKRFKFDDVYLGLIAKKLDIEPFHCEEFHFWPKQVSPQGYRYVVASHGFSNPQILEKAWNKQKEAGNA